MKFSVVERIVYYIALIIGLILSSINNSPILLLFIGFWVMVTILVSYDDR